MELVLVISHTALAPSDWSLAFRSTPQIEGARSITIKRGAVPEDLMGGTLYKNGPALFERGETSYAHWLDGDGCVTRLHFTPNGGAEWRARFVQTEAFTQESRRDDVCWRTTFGTQRPGGVLSNMFDIRLKSPANTHVLPLPGSDNVLALWEAGPPYELDGDTLAMLGPCSLGGRLRLSGSHGALPATTSIEVLDRLLERAGLLTDACSAHPREETNAGGDTSTIAWTWRQTLVGQPAIKVALHDLSALSQLAPSPPPVRATLEGVPFAPHDMALAENFACFMTSPTQVSIAPFVLGFAALHSARRSTLRPWQAVPPAAESTWWSGAVSGSISNSSMRHLGMQTTTMILHVLSISASHTTPSTMQMLGRRPATPVAVGAGS